MSSTVPQSLSREMEAQECTNSPLESQYQRNSWNASFPKLSQSGRLPFLPRRQLGPKRGLACERDYPSDEVGAELGPNARVWHVYLDEADEYDAELVNSFRDITDVLLIFAGLFSAVVSSFLSQSSQALQPDYAQITASLMTELVGIQRAIASGRSLAEVPNSQLTFTNDNTTTQFDRWVNTLWFTSLTLSLIAALLSVLAKRWLLYYTSALSGTPRQRVLVRHFRFMGLERWRVSGIIKILPIILHTALLLFLAGLVIYVWEEDHVAAILILNLASLTSAFYWCTSLLAAFIPGCSYKTPISDLIIHAREIVKWLCRSRIARSPHSARKSYFGRRYHFKFADHQTRLSPRTIERRASEAQMDDVLISALVWLSSAATDPQTKRIVNMSFAGLPFGFNTPIPADTQTEIIDDYRTHNLDASDKETLYRSLALVGKTPCERYPHPLCPLLRAVWTADESGTTQSQHLCILASILPKHVQLPPLLWMRLFERKDPPHSSIHDIPSLFAVVFHHLDILRRLDWHKQPNKWGTKGMNWSLPPQISLQDLCEREPQMKHTILGFLYRLFSVSKISSDVAPPFLPVLRVALQMLKDSDVLVNSKETVVEHVIVAEKVLLSIPFTRWCDADFVELLHHCLEIQNRLGAQRSFPHVTPLYCRIRVRAGSLGLVLLYCLDMLQRPWRCGNGEDDEEELLRKRQLPWSLLTTLFQTRERDVFQAFLDSDGLSLLSRCSPICFNTTYPLHEINAMRVYIHSLSLLTPLRQEHIEYVAQPRHLAWFMWHSCCQSQSGNLDVLCILSRLLPKRQSWTAAADILVDEFQREACLEGSLVHISQHWMGIAKNVRRALSIVGLGDSRQGLQLARSMVHLPYG